MNFQILLSFLGFALAVQAVVLPVTCSSNDIICSDDGSSYAECYEGTASEMVPVSEGFQCIRNELIHENELNVTEVGSSLTKRLEARAGTKVTVDQVRRIMEKPYNCADKKKTDPKFLRCATTAEAAASLSYGFAKYGITNPKIKAILIAYTMSGSQDLRLDTGPEYGQGTRANFRFAAVFLYAKDLNRLPVQYAHWGDVGDDDIVAKLAALPIEVKNSIRNSLLDPDTSFAAPAWGFKRLCEEATQNTLMRVPKFDWRLVTDIGKCNLFPVPGKVSPANWNKNIAYLNRAFKVFRVYQ